MVHHNIYFCVFLYDFDFCLQFDKDEVQGLSTLVLSLGQSLYGATSEYQEQSTSGDHLTILML